MKVKLHLRVIKQSAFFFLEEPQFHLKRSSQEKTKNIILIAVDSLRYNEFMNSKFSHYFNKKLNFLHRTSFYQHRAQSNDFKDSYNINFEFQVP